MQFRGMEDRLNPIAPPDADEATLGGYAAIHGRAPGFEGSDGSSYTAAIEVEAQPPEGWAGYLVFIRWAAEGSAIMGHYDSPDLVVADSESGAREALSRLPLHHVKELLEDAIERHREWDEI